MSHNNIVSYLETGVAIYLLLFIYIYTIQSILLQQFFFLFGFYAKYSKISQIHTLA